MVREAEREAYRLQYDLGKHLSYLGMAAVLGVSALSAILLPSPEGAVYQVILGLSLFCLAAAVLLAALDMRDAVNRVSGRRRAPRRSYRLSLGWYLLCTGVLLFAAFAAQAIGPYLFWGPALALLPVMLAARSPRRAASPKPRRRTRPGEHHPQRSRRRAG
jgi:peptidoglycan/LPS O-acetylase OafA/YrhL